MNIRDMVRKQIETAAPLNIKPSATSKDSAAPDAQTTLNIAKKFDTAIRKALGDIEKDSTVTVGRLIRDQEIKNPVFFMVFTIKVPRKIAASGGADEFLDELFRSKITKRNPIKVGKYACWISNGEVNASATIFTVDCTIQYTGTVAKGTLGPNSPFMVVKGNMAEKQAAALKRDSRKLKSFMKENGIDLNAIKSMLKHL